MQARWLAMVDCHRDKARFALLVGGRAQAGACGEWRVCAWGSSNGIAWHFQHGALSTIRGIRGRERGVYAPNFEGLQTPPPAYFWITSPHTLLRNHSYAVGDFPALELSSYHLNISEKKNFPNPVSVSVFDMKFRNSSALLRNASLMLS